MNVLARIQAGGRQIEYGIASTRHEREAVQAQRFRVYQRHGYYRAGLRTDRDVYDSAADYFLARLLHGDGAVLLGSARVVRGQSRDGFRLPAEHDFEFESPNPIAKTAVAQRAEITRVVAESVRGIVVGGLLTPLGLIQAIATFGEPLDIRCGFAVIKRRLLRALQAAGVTLHEITPARLVYPTDGSFAGYYHQHPDPVVPVWWLTEEIVPSILEAIGRYRRSK